MTPTKGRSPVKNVNLAFTKELADQFLSRNVENNRNLKPRAISQIMEDIAEGQYFDNPHPICVVGDLMTGQVIDGQNRLTAVSKGGVPVDMHVAYNCSMDVMKVLDNGTRRRPSDAMKILDDEKYGNKLCAMAIVLAGLDGTDHVPSRMPYWKAKKIVARHPKGIEWARSKFKVTNFSNGLILGTFAWAYPVEEELIDEFYDRMSEGDCLRKDSPELRIRDMLLRTKTPSNTTARQATSFKILRALTARMGGDQKMTKMYLTTKGYDEIAMRRGMSPDQRAWAEKVVSWHLGRKERMR